MTVIGSEVPMILKVRPGRSERMRPHQRLQLALSRISRDRWVTGDELEDLCHRLLKNIGNGNDTLIIKATLTMQDLCLGIYRGENVLGSWYDRGLTYDQRENLENDISSVCCSVWQVEGCTKSGSPRKKRRPLTGITRCLYILESYVEARQ